jgi:hypothetical protein
MPSSKRATILEWFWWIVTPLFIVCVELIPQRIMLALTAGMSSMALAITYGSKSEAAKAKELNESE